MSQDKSNIGSKPLSRRFRQRRRELLPITRAFFEQAPHYIHRLMLERQGVRIGPTWPPKHYTRPLEAVVNWELEFKGWTGHANPELEPRFTDLELNRAREFLMQRRTFAGDGTDFREIDKALEALWQIQDETDCLLVLGAEEEDKATARYQVDAERTARIALAKKEHPVLGDAFAHAEEALTAERKRWHAGAERLEREISEGYLPFREKLRRNVSEWRRRGLLPR